jgi:hypothetical protein
MNGKLGSSHVVRELQLEILIVREHEVGCSHVVREYELGILTVWNPYRNSRREIFSSSEAKIYLLSVDIVAFKLGFKESQRSQAVRNKIANNDWIKAHDSITLMASQGHNREHFDKTSVRQQIPFTRKYQELSTLSDGRQYTIRWVEEDTTRSIAQALNPGRKCLLCFQVQWKTKQFQSSSTTLLLWGSDPSANAAKDLAEGKTNTSTSVNS